MLLSGMIDTKRLLIPVFELTCAACLFLWNYSEPVRTTVQHSEPGLQGSFT